MKASKKAYLLLNFAIIILMMGCSGLAFTPMQKQAVSTETPIEIALVSPPSTPTNIPQETISLWIDPNLPVKFQQGVKFDSSIQSASDKDQATYFITAETSAQSGKTISATNWVFALVEPFPSLMDDVKQDDILRMWKGETGGALDGKTLYLSDKTKALFEEIWGPATGTSIKTVETEKLVETSWANQPSLALVEFGDLQPRWKVVRVDGFSPLDKKIDIEKYPLTVKFGLFTNGNSASISGNPGLPSSIILPDTNRDTNKMTVLVMTGVTALVRATAAKMETKGITYPAQDILDWLKDADITHISNEVSFNPYCPPPDGNKMTLHFCSSPIYIELLDYIGADVIDLTGNHQNDYGRDALTFSLNLYKEHGMKTFAAGNNAAEAKQPITMEDHGNKIAFIGCNPAGPELDWATDTKPGTANCDFPYMEAQIKQLSSQGYLVIATFQYFENYGYTPSVGQFRDFRRLSNAGAVIVHGDQAHFTQIMEFNGEKFIHFGLSNLFFDQMHVDVNGETITQTRREVLDRHVFYDGKYISTELLTAMLEDYARPRPMTPDERNKLLSDLFKASGW